MHGRHDRRHPVTSRRRTSRRSEETLLGDPADLHETEVVDSKRRPAEGANGDAGTAAAAHGATAADGSKASRTPAWMRQTSGAVKHGADVSAEVADAVYGRIQKITRAEGAGESGLAHVIELNAVVATGDLLVTVALATSLFFSLQPGEARSKVALYLVVTMVPFVLLAPVIGPLLDRLRGGRRFAMALTALIRGLLALVLAKTIAGGSLAIYPAAFGILAASRAYGVSRSAVIPRVLPSGTSLVRANSRINLFTLFATLAATPIGYGLGKLSAAAPLVLAALVFFVGTAMALRLPKIVDSDEGETDRATAPRGPRPQSAGGAAGQDAAGQAPALGGPERAAWRCGRPGRCARSPGTWRCTSRSCCAPSRSAG